MIRDLVIATVTNLVLIILLVNLLRGFKVLYKIYKETKNDEN